MNTQINQQFATMQKQFDQKHSSLITQMDSLHMQIDSTEQFITALLLLMEEQADSKSEEIRKAFTNVLNSLEQINTDYNAAHIEIQNLITFLQEAEDAYHAETLSVLTVMESNMTEGAIQNLNKITDSLQTLQENFDMSITNMQSEMSNNYSALQEMESNYFEQTILELTIMENNLNNELNSRLTQHSSNIFERLALLDTNIINQYNDLSNTVNNYNNDQQEYLENMMTTVMQSLQTVFQSVSDGKRNLASALLTKGVTIKVDATFNEIQQAILDIPQQLLIGVEQIPGEISYDYHYHVDAMGDTPHAEHQKQAGGCYMLPQGHVHNGSSISGGECYNIPMYHIHTGSIQNGGGCYNTPVYHTHTSSCDKSGRIIGSHSYSGSPCSTCGSPTSTYKKTCNNCGTVTWSGSSSYCANGHGGGGSTATAGADYGEHKCGGYSCGKSTSTIDSYNLSCNKSTLTIDAYSLSCGKTTETEEYFLPSCGFSDGQIIAAHIIYISKE